MKKRSIYQVLSIVQINNEWQIVDVVYSAGLICNFTKIEKITKVTRADGQDNIHTTFLDGLVHQVENSCTYLVTVLCVSKFNFIILLKTTEKNRLKRRRPVYY